ncbi:hypothetical protein F7725_003847 [Dissostichus mawsoni]|uniref:Uncharacterized protein n=1 Tax=Dissostichus mawsoni TaxID=36200 RepID=A0A7J5YDB6_DISMA|nr:hypothetical protein F7725_003847 [Dissostichus mawsoni]
MSTGYPPFATPSINNVASAGTTMIPEGAAISTGTMLESSVMWLSLSRASSNSLVSSASLRACWASGPPTQLKDLQRHGEARLFGPHQRPVVGAEVLAGRQQQQHGQLVSKLQQLAEQVGQPLRNQNPDLFHGAAQLQDPHVQTRLRPLNTVPVEGELLLENREESMSMAVGSGSRGVLLRFFSRRANGIQWSGGSRGL